MAPTEEDFGEAMLVCEAGTHKSVYEMHHLDSHYCLLPVKAR